MEVKLNEVLLKTENFIEEKQLNMNDKNEI